MARPKGVQDLPRMIQGGALRYFKIQGDKGRAMSDIWHDLFEADQFKAMDLVMKIIPKELMINIDGNITLDTTLLPAASIKEVFSGTGIEHGTEGDVVAVQGSDTLEAPERTPVGSVPQPG